MSTLLRALEGTKIRHLERHLVSSRADIVVTPRHTLTESSYAYHKKRDLRVYMICESMEEG